MNPPKVFISSTLEDLADFRAAADAAGGSNGFP